MAAPVIMKVLGPVDWPRIVNGAMEIVAPMRRTGTEFGDGLVRAWIARPPLSEPAVVNGCVLVGCDAMEGLEPWMMLAASKTSMRLPDAKASEHDEVTPMARPG